MANKTINQLPNAAVVATDEYEKQSTGGGASQKNTAAQLLTFIQNNATSFAQAVNMVSNFSVGGISNVSIANNGNIIIGGANVTLIADGSASFADTGLGVAVRISAGGIVTIGEGSTTLNPDGTASFANNTVTIDANGNISVAQDVLFGSTNFGVVLKSPNGTKYRIKVNDGGQLGTEPA